MPIKSIKKKFKYPSKKIINLILDINDYKNFLPWCKNSIVHSIKENSKHKIILADLEIGYKFFSDTYSSKVILDKKKSSIKVISTKGPLSKLENYWIIKNLSKNECLVDFYIDIELKNPMLNIMLHKFFEIGFEKILNSFEERAEKIIN